MTGSTQSNHTSTELVLREQISAQTLALSCGGALQPQQQKQHWAPPPHQEPIPTPSIFSMSASQSTFDRGEQPAGRPSTSSSSPDTYGGRKRKRNLNTQAARRYRQRKADRLTELEEALSKVTAERDEFKLRLARAEAEADVLKAMIGKKG